MTAQGLHSLYINGRLDATANPARDVGADAPGSNLWYNRSINGFGGFIDGYHGTGVIAYVLEWQRDLSDTEIELLSTDPAGPFRQIRTTYVFLDVPATGDATVPAGAGALGISGLNPSVEAASVALAGIGALAATGIAPSVTASFSGSPAPGVTEITGQPQGITIATDPPAFVGVGTYAVGDHDDVLTPGLHGDVAPGDFLMTFGYLRNAGTLSISDGWTQRSLVDTVQNGSSFYLQTWYRYATGTGDAATITPANGVTSPQSLTAAFTVAFRNVHPTNPFSTDGADTFNVAAGDIGPILAPTATEIAGGVIVFGARNGTVATGANALTGDDLTWAEIARTTNTVNSLGITVVAYFGTWNSGVPTLTSKTIDLVGGAGAPGFGKMFQLNTPASATPTDVAIGAGALAVAGLQPSISISLDAAAGAGIVAIAGAAPDVSAGSNVTAGAGVIEIDGLTPQLAGDAVADIGAGALAIIGAAPAVVVGTSTTVGAGTIEASGIGQSVSASAVVTAGAGALAIEGKAPVWLDLVPQTGALEIEGAAPGMVLSQSITIGTGTLEIEAPGGPGGRFDQGPPMAFISSGKRVPSPSFIRSGLR